MSHMYSLVSHCGSRREPRPFTGAFLPERQHCQPGTFSVARAALKMGFCRMEQRAASPLRWVGFERALHASRPHLAQALA
jgi:hypothetical protein